MKVLLVVPRDPYLDNDRVMPPLGVMSLKSYLDSLGVDTQIETDFDKSLLRRYGDYTHVGISCVTPQAREAEEILYAMKAAHPETKVVLGGPHAQFYYHDAWNHPWDHLVVGDGEEAFRAILFEPWSCWKTVVEPVDADTMNAFPVPYRDPAFLRQYRFPVCGRSATTMVTAKGCPMSCAFCEHSGEPVRLYTPANVERQLQDVVAAGFDAVMFFDDIFTLSMKRVRELAPLVQNAGLAYRCFGHANTMTEAMAKLLADTGCVEIGFGAESGSQKILDAVEKRTTVEKNKEFVRICNEHGIRVKAFLIAGLPGESHETLSETERFLDYLISRGDNDFDMTVYYPYKGTRIRDSIDRGENTYDLFLSDGEKTWGFYKGVNGRAEVMVRTSALSAQEIERAQRRFLGTYK